MYCWESEDIEGEEALLQGVDMEETRGRKIRENRCVLVLYICIGVYCIAALESMALHTSTNLG